MIGLALGATRSASLPKIEKIPILIPSFVSTNFLLIILSENSFSRASSLLSLLSNTALLARSEGISPFNREVFITAASHSGPKSYS